MRRLTIAALGVAMAVLLGLGSLGSIQAAEEIDHFGRNDVDFSAAGRLSPKATGKGIIDFRGGDEPESQWRSTFRFSHLESRTEYAVVVKGRFGGNDSDESDEYTELCSFETNTQGKGSCFWYFRGLARLDVVQLRVRDEDGRRVMQASRGDGPGEITTDPNRFSPGGEIPNRNNARQKKDRR